MCTTESKHATRETRAHIYVAPFPINNKRIIYLYTWFLSLYVHIRCIRFTWKGVPNTLLVVCRSFWKVVGMSLKSVIQAYRYGNSLLSGYDARGVYRSRYYMR